MISNIDWKKIAPKPEDQARLAAKFRAAGLPLDNRFGFLNGVPQFTKPVDEKELLKVIEGKSKKKK